jgi:hypothetical protein
MPDALLRHVTPLSPKQIRHAKKRWMLIHEQVARWITECEQSVTEARMPDTLCASSGKRHDEQDFAPLGDTLRQCKTCQMVVDLEYQPLAVDEIGDEDGGDEHLK